MMDDDVTARIEAQSYPVETSDLAENVGEIDRRAGEAVERAGNGLIDSSEDAQLTLQCGLGGDAVGRRRYSDRDPGSVGETEHRRLSF
jgi:hypothetical protein